MAAPASASASGDAAAAAAAPGDSDAPLFDAAVLGVPVGFGPCEIVIKPHDSDPARLVTEFVGPEAPVFEDVWAACQAAGIEEGKAPDVSTMPPFQVRNTLQEREHRLLAHTVRTRLQARDGVEVGVSDLENGPTLGGAPSPAGLPKVTVSFLTAEERAAFETMDADTNTSFYVPMMNGSEDVVLKVVQGEDSRFTVDAWGRRASDPPLRRGWHTASALDMWYRRGHLGTWEGILEVWVGRHQTREGREPPVTVEGGEWGVGNNILVRFADDAEGRHCYAVMGVVAKSFKTDELIVEFGSVVGNSNVPYPVAFTASLGITMDDFETKPRSEVEALIAAEPCAHDDCWHHISGSGTRIDPALCEVLWDRFSSPLGDLPAAATAAAVPALASAPAE